MARHNGNTRRTKHRPRREPQKAPARELDKDSEGNPPRHELADSQMMEGELSPAAWFLMMANRSRQAS